MREDSIEGFGGHTSIVEWKGCMGMSKKKKTRRNHYEKSVIGKFGARDLLHTDPGEESFYNKQGAIVYRDPGRHAYLDIPSLLALTEPGVVYNVLSVGFLGGAPNPVPVATVRVGELPILYRLPVWYLDWVMQAQGLAHSGLNLFPCDVEFGYIAPENRYYADYV